MSKFAENVIKIAYENRANAMIAAKQAAEGEGRLQKMMNWLNDPANKGKATAIESGLGGLAAGGLGFGLTKALGGSTGRAWANASMAGGGTAAGIAGLKYRGEIGNALKSLVKGNKIPGTPNGPELDDVMNQVQRTKNEDEQRQHAADEKINQSSQPQIDPGAKYTGNEAPQDLSKPGSTPRGYKANESGSAYKPGWNKSQKDIDKDVALAEVKILEKAMSENAKKPQTKTVIDETQALYARYEALKNKWGLW